MIRLVLILVLLNLLYFGWKSVQPGTDQAQSRTMHSPDIGELVLLSERDTPSSQQSQEVSSPLLAAQTPFVVRCIKLTQALYEATAESTTNRLVGQGFSIRLVNEKTVLEPDFRVIYPPLESFDAARQLTESLVEAGIQGFVIPSGEQRNGVSLGLFSEQQGALDRVAQVAELKLSEIEPVIVRHARIELQQYAYIVLDEEMNPALVGARLSELGLNYAEAQPCPQLANILSDI